MGAASGSASGPERTVQEGGTVLDQILELIDQTGDLLHPFVVAGIPVPSEVKDNVNSLIAEADALAGGDAGAFLEARLREAEPTLLQIEAEWVPFAGLAPPYSVRYVAEIFHGHTRLILRGATDPDGQYAIFLPRDGDLRFLLFHDPQTNSFATAQTRLLDEFRFQIRPFFMYDLDELEEPLSDFDNDGLPDVVEVVHGTLTWNPDSDGDGVMDGAEVSQGTDPLDGLPVITGIIASVDTPGLAVDVCAVNQVAAVADSASGVSVFKVVSGLSPTAIARVDTPGSASAVACAGDRIAVADGAAGLIVIDVTDPPAARIIHQVALGGNVRAVAAGGPIAYAGVDNGTIAAVDLATGAVLQQVNVGSAVQDIAIEKETLYALTVGTLYALPLTGGSLQVAGSVASSGFVPPVTGRLRLFVGGGIAYAVHVKGYNTFDLSDPIAPSLIASGSTAQFGWKQIAPNGSGLGIAAVGLNASEGGPHHVWLYDVSDPAQTDVFLTLFETPGLARAVSIFNGLAYVADSGSGLQVINYLAYDALGVPPTITLSASFALDPGEAEEGKLARVTADVTDDVQVRNVEFHVDGVKVFTDGSFPFEHRFITPLVARQPSFTLRARASDTGGNATWTDEMVITLGPDVTPPSVVTFSPPDGSDECPESTTAVSVTFSEPIDLATLDESTFQLFSAGQDGIIGNEDDVPVAGQISFRNEINTALLSFGAALPGDSYHAVLSGSVADLAGHPLGTEFDWTFGVFLPVAGCCQPGCPGCTEAAVEACVCQQAPFCCGIEWDDLCVVLVEFYGCGTCDGSGLITEAVGPQIVVENLTDPTGPAIGESVGPQIVVENLTDPTGPAIGEAVGPNVSVENLGTPP